MFYNFCLSSPYIRLQWKSLKVYFFHFDILTRYIYIQILTNIITVLRMTRKLGKEISVDNWLYYIDMLQRNKIKK